MYRGWTLPPGAYLLKRMYVAMCLPAQPQLGVLGAGGTPYGVSVTPLALPHCLFCLLRPVIYCEY